MQLSIRIVIHLLVVSWHLAIMKSFLFLLEEIKKSVSPLTNCSYVQANVVIIFWSTAKSEGMPELKFILVTI
jgi:hypothetical protein